MRRGRWLTFGLLLLYAAPVAASNDQEPNAALPPPSTSIAPNAFDHDEARIAGYSWLRTKLLKEHIDPRASLGILAAFTGGVAPLITKYDTATLDLKLQPLSLRAQACQAKRLDKISVDLKGRARRRGPPIDLIIGDAVETSAYYGGALNALHNIVESAVDLNLKCHQKDDEQIKPRARWVEPIRIASTGDRETDLKVVVILSQIKRIVPGTPIDESSFQNNPKDANIWLTSPGQYGVYYSLMRYKISKSCDDVRSMIGMTNKNNSPSMHLFDTGYLTEPYDFQGERNVLVQTGQGGAIIQAACGLSPSGIPWGQLGNAQANPDEPLFRCLVGSMGASILSIPNNPAERPFEKMKEIALAQLSYLYKSK